VNAVKINDGEICGPKQPPQIKQIDWRLSGGSGSEDAEATLRVDVKNPSRGYKEPEIELKVTYPEDTRESGSSTAEITESKTFERSERKEFRIEMPANQVKCEDIKSGTDSITVHASAKDLSVDTTVDPGPLCQ
jgi:hypothetical protein